MRRFLVGLLAVLSSALCLKAQDTEPADSLVRLMSAQSAQMINKDGVNYRKVIGPARFLHNNTYLICDTAYWDVDKKIINAFGHVQILQDETVLSSDKLDYFIDDDLAQFRGSVVQLQDKEQNTLRTRHLDYNTKDSIAVFKNGASMKDADGQVIESLDGTYDSQMKLFTFEKDVNMFTDSVFVRTSKLFYWTKFEKAEFCEAVDFWKDDNMLSSDYGYYNKQYDFFHFHDNVHGMSENQEVWTDTLHFYKPTNNIETFGSTQVTDTSRAVTALCEHLEYVDSLAQVTLQRNAAIIARTTNSHNETDTLWVGADKLIYQSLMKWQVSKDEIAASQTRLTNVNVDPVGEYRRKAAEDAAAEAAKKQEEYNKKMGIVTDKPESGTAAEPETESAPAVEPAAEQDTAPAIDSTSAGVAMDSTALSAALDSTALSSTLDSAALASAVDSTYLAPKDSTKIGFVQAMGDVRVFRKDMQARCDSLLYCDLDSLARLFEDPRIWNEGNRQYVADSITLVVQNEQMQKANLMSNAFITIQEDSLLFDQIRSTEMLAFFDSTTALTRFDALGGSTALFYVQENDALATANKVESRMLSAYFVNGEVETVYYFDKPQNDAYPTVQLPNEDKQMKGFRWEPDDRPASRYDITTLDVRAPEKARYLKHPKSKFKQTDIYFPGYMKKIYAEIATRDSLAKIEKARKQEASVDSLAIKDSLFVADSLAIADSLAAVDTAILEPIKDSLETAVAPVDTTAAPAVEEPVLSEKERKAKAREEARAAKDAAREAKWAELDERDALIQAKKDAKAREKKRIRTAQLLKKMEKQAADDQKVLDRYKAKFEKQKAKAEARKAAKKTRGVVKQLRSQKAEQDSE